MSGKVFADTNIWVYAHLENPDDPRHQKASRIVLNTSGLVISIQVLNDNEYYSVMLKNGAPDDLIQANIGIMLDRFETRWFSPAILTKAFAVRTCHGFSWWDSLVIATALDAGCPTLYTEDLQHGQTIETVTVVNPFLLELDDT